jgi:CelD/BcsL family acetyltransferase involved in cellulose biosynthesis
MSVKWSHEWTAEFDEALEALPAPEGCNRGQYRELLHPASTPKRHALVTRHGEPSALISLRRRMRFWEPVAYQVLPGFIAPASDMAALGHALASLGVEVRVPAGLDQSVHELACGKIGAYEVYQIDLRSDYEAHWHKKNQRHLSTVRRARRRCAGLAHRIDGEGDLEWIASTWREQWLADPGQEVAAAQDRVRFWSALPKAPGDHWSARTLQLVDGAQRVAGVVMLCRKGVASFQCWARNSAFDKLGAGNRALDLAIAWAASEGYERFDLGGGSVKHRWGTVGGERYRVAVRPWVLEVLHRAAPD